MAISVAFSGSEAVSTTEHSMTTDTAGPDTETSDGVFQLFLDLNDMTTDDILQVRIYEKVSMLLPGKLAAMCTRRLF
jgi:hypothetical protein